MICHEHYIGVNDDAICKSKRKNKKSHPCLQVILNRSVASCWFKFPARGGCLVFTSATSCIKTACEQSLSHYSYFCSNCALPCWDLLAPIYKRFWSVDRNSSLLFKFKWNLVSERILVLDLSRLSQIFQQRGQFIPFLCIFFFFLFFFFFLNFIWTQQR